MKKNILFIHHGDNWIRGTENVLLTLLSGINKSRYSIEVVCNHEIMAERIRQLEYEAHVIRLPIIMKDGNYLKLDFFIWAKAFFILHRLIRKTNTELLYLNSGRSAQIGYFVGRLLKIPTICHIHYSYYWRHIFLYRMHKVDYAIFVSRNIMKKLTNRIKFSSKNFVIHNAVDLEKFSPLTMKRDPFYRDKYNIPSDGVVIGQVSSISERKGIEVLINVISTLNKKYKNVFCVIVGDGPFLKQAKDIAHKKQANIIFPGYCKKPQIFYQQLFDINVLASQNEALPLALIEAAACGLPSVAFDAGGNGEVIIDRETGYLCKNGDINQFERKIEALVLDENLRQQIGIAARNDALKRFSLRRHVDDIESIIERASNG